MYFCLLNKFINSYESILNLFVIVSEGAGGGGGGVCVWGGGGSRKPLTSGSRVIRCADFATHVDPRMDLLLYHFSLGLELFFFFFFRVQYIFY